VWLVAVILALAIPRADVLFKFRSTLLDADGEPDASSRQM
jgi:hypothetical protein